MNTDDNEKLLAQAAMRTIAYPIQETVAAAKAFERAMYTVRPPAKRVKGFDNGTAKAERRKAQRAKQHHKRITRNR